MRFITPPFGIRACCVQVLLLDADTLSGEGNFPQAFEVVARAQKQPNADQAQLLTIKASIVSAQLFMGMNSPGMTEDMAYLLKGQLEEVERIYKEALDLEPNAIEVMAQWAQLKSMISGDFKGEFC
jgi:hypothetical protein